MLTFSAMKENPVKFHFAMLKAVVVSRKIITFIKLTVVTKYAQAEDVLSKMAQLKASLFSAYSPEHQRNSSSAAITEHMAEEGTFQLLALNMFNHPMFGYNFFFIACTNTVSD